MPSLKLKLNFKVECLLKTPNLNLAYLLHPKVGINQPISSSNIYHRHQPKQSTNNLPNTL